MVNPSILLLALLDGLNLCALTLLALFISLMFLYNVSRGKVLLLGFAYMAGVYISYFTTGLGVALLALTLPSIPHLLSRVGAGLMLFFGAANIVNYFRAGTIPTKIPNSLGKRAVGYMRSFSKGTSFPAVIFVGTLVGLHNFPCACTGGIYMTFIGLVSSSSLFLPYLAAYNLVFVIPLLAILLFCSSKAVTLRFRKWHESSEHKVKLVIGTVMVSVASGILVMISMGLV